MPLRKPRKDLSGASAVIQSESSLADLNKSLHILATLFPRIRPEVFRETLQAFGGESRLQIVIDQLLRHQDSWVKGRWRPPTREAILSTEDEFRRASYIWAVKSALYQEFKSLNKSTIKAVLAEENFCYTRARPTLQKLVSTSWRATFNTFWSRWRKPAESPPSHFMLEWVAAEDGKPTIAPVLKKTGDVELDRELHETVIAPLLEKMKREQELQDWTTATALNEEEARSASAMYECECCFSETVFEQMATCDTDSHIICFECITHAINESLFGQGWGRNIDHSRSQLRCLAPTSQEGCTGCLPPTLVQRCILQTKAGAETYSTLQMRLTTETLSKALLPLITCPFCPYSEIDDLYIPPQTTIYKPNLLHPLQTLTFLLLTLNFLPLFLLYHLLHPFLALPPLPHLLRTSLRTLSRRTHLPQRFTCLNPTCGTPSCLNCHKPWSDPHTCHESASLSLRTTIEAARTAALKRTCPKCHLAFIKDSGCNKLTCVCGYVMCYVCRQGLDGRNGGNGGGAREGYRHFCQHFRPAGGVCAECERCDLYRNADEEAVVAEAGRRAEREWRVREGMVGVEGVGGERGKGRGRGVGGLQGLCDWWVGRLVTC